MSTWWLPGRKEPEQVYECRSCGTSLEDGTVECPYCGPTEVVVYDI